MESSYEDSYNKAEAERQACCLCRCQANFQAVLRPAVWIPGLRTPHQYTEEWRIGTNPGVCLQEVLIAVKKLNVVCEGGNVYEINKIINDTFLEVLVYTRMQCLYVLDFRFLSDPETGGTNIKVRSFATGWLPVCIPLSFLLNMLLFLVPFYDWAKSNKWVHRVRETLTLEIRVMKAKRYC